MNYNYINVHIDYIIGFLMRCGVSDFNNLES